LVGKKSITNIVNDIIATDLSYHTVFKMIIAILAVYQE
jgi:hypothetical protein